MGCSRCSPFFDHPLLQQLDHSFAHTEAHIHISFCIAAVVRVGGTANAKRVAVDGGSIAFELRVLRER